MPAGLNIPNYGGFLSDLIDTRGQQDYSGLDNTGVDNVMQLGVDAPTFLNESGAAATAAAKGPAISQFTTKIDKDGQARHTVEMSDEAFKFAQEMMSLGQNAVAEQTALQQMLRSKRDVLEQNPVLAQVGKILSLAATAYQAPNSRGAPLVHAAGAYAGEYFQDSPESLQAQIANAEAKKLAIQAPIYQELATSARLKHQEDVEANREAARQTRLKLNQEKSDRSSAAQLFNSAMTSARTNGDYTEGAYTESLKSILLDSESTDEQVKAVEAQAAAEEKMLKSAAQAAENKRLAAEQTAFDRQQALFKQQDALLRQREADRVKHEQELQDRGLTKQGLPWLGRIESVEGKIEKANLLGAQSQNLIEAERQKMDEAGIPGFDNVKESTDSLAAKLVNVYSKRNVDLPPEKEGGKPRREAVAKLLDFTDDKEQAAALKNVLAAQSGYQAYKSEIDNLYRQHDELRKGYTAATKMDYPSIRPAAPPPPMKQDASMYYKWDELKVMTEEQLRLAAKQDRIAPELVPRVKELVQKQKEAKGATGPTVSFKDAAKAAWDWLMNEKPPAR